MKTKSLLICGVLVTLVCLAAMLEGCSSGPKVEALLIGSWRMHQGKVHSILTFHNNGSWSLENRVEGKLSKIVAKRGRITGEWFYTDELDKKYVSQMDTIEAPSDDGSTDAEAEEGQDQDNSQPTIYLIMHVAESDGDDDWQPGITVPFEILILDKERLSLKNFNGDIMEWSRVRVGKSEETDIEGTVKMNLGPMVINLSRTRIRQRRRYLCIDVDLVLEVSYHNTDGLPPEPPAMHPRIKEAAIFYLSAKTYKDLKSVDDAQNVISGLKNVLNPYLQGKIQELTINNIVVSTERKNVEDFLNRLLKPQDVEDLPEDVPEDAPEDEA